MKYRAAELKEECASRPQTTKSYLTVLEKEPKNIKALEHLLSVSRYNDEKSGYYYRLLMEVFFVEDFPRAVVLFDEYFPAHVDALPSKILLRLGRYFYKNNGQSKAMFCLECAAERGDPLQAKALTFLADSYVAIDNMAMANKVWKTIIGKFPGTPFAVEAQRKYKEATNSTRAHEKAAKMPYRI